MGGVGGSARPSRQVRRHVSTARLADGRHRRNVHGDQAIARAMLSDTDFLPKTSWHWRRRSAVLVISGPKESFSAPRPCASRAQASTPEASRWHTETYDTTQGPRMECKKPQVRQCQSRKGTSRAGIQRSVLAYSSADMCTHSAARCSKQPKLCTTRRSAGMPWLPRHCRT